MSFDGVAMTESVACLMHISDLYPDAALAPAPGTPERGQWYRWLVYLLSPVQSTFYGFIAPGRSAPVGAQDAVKAHAIDALEGYRTMLDAHLAANGRYLLGELFTGADLFLFMLTRWGRNLPRKAWTLPSLGAHYRRLAERPSVVAMLEKQGIEAFPA